MKCRRHFFTNMDFGLGFILNELMLVLVGTAVGVFVNLFQNTSRIQKLIRQEIAVADRNMQEILRQIVKELTVPESSENVWKQLEELETPLPASREEFENRAILYHILMDLEEFLKMKKKFVDSLTEDQMERYWQSNG